MYIYALTKLSFSIRQSRILTIWNSHRVTFSDFTTLSQIPNSQMSVTTQYSTLLSKEEADRLSSCGSLRIPGTTRTGTVLSGDESLEIEGSVLVERANAAWLALQEWAESPQSQSARSGEDLDSDTLDVLAIDSDPRSIPNDLLRHLAVSYNAVVAAYERSSDVPSKTYIKTKLPTLESQLPASWMQALWDFGLEYERRFNPRGGAYLDPIAGDFTWRYRLMLSKLVEGKLGVGEINLDDVDSTTLFE